MKYKRLWFIALYMIFIYIVILTEMKYARQHPIEDQRPSQQIKH
jgi:hypothetical protein